VLVTGATTPIGRALVESLLGDPAAGVVLAAGAEERDDQLPDESARFHYLRVDLTHARQVRSLLFGPSRDAGVGAIVHTALHRSPGDSGRMVRQLNVDATCALLHLAERHPTIRRFVYRSFAEVYRIDGEQPSLLGEEHSLNLSPEVPQWVRDRVESDVSVCARMGMSPLEIVVLRCAEVFAPDSGSQLWDYLSSRLCLRPLGYDPMLNLLTVEDAVRALSLAIAARGSGLYNVPGFDTLPLSRLVALGGCLSLPLPGPLLSPLYRLRTAVTGHEFRYDMNAGRFHFTGVLDGAHAREELGYEPATSILRWPRGCRGRA
jgi:UDP-glucose 4-epimerase